MRGWGQTYASKTLMFMLPDRYVALDDRMRKRLRPFIRASPVAAYLTFLRLCRFLQRQVTDAPPDHSRYPNFPKGPPPGRWLLAEIEQSIFQCTRENTITPCFHPEPALRWPMELPTDEAGE